MSNNTLLAFMNAFSSGVSGGDIAFIRFARRMDDYKITVVTSLLGQKLCIREGLKAKYLLTSREKTFRFIIPTYLIRTFRACLLLAFSPPPRYVYSTSDFLPDVIPALMIRKLHNTTRWVQKIFHLISPERRIPSSAQKISLRLIKKSADLIIVDNDLLKGSLEDLGFEPRRLRTITPGIDWEMLQETPPEKENDYEGVFSGRLHQSKGIFELIDIWRLVVDKLPDSRLLILGGGNERIQREIKIKIEASGLQENIVLSGYHNHPEVIKLLKSGQIFIFPSHEEGFGIAIAEAMACGLPIVAYDLPSYSVNFPGVIKVVSEGDTRAMAQEVLKLLTDKNTYRACREKGWEFSRRLDWRIIAEVEKHLIEHLSAQSRFFCASTK